MALTEVINRRNQRSIPVWLFALVAILIVGRFALKRTVLKPAARQKASLVKWVAPADAVKLAQQSGKPIMYEFTADWCPPCHRLEDEVFGDVAFATRINNGVIPVRLTDRMREDGRNDPEVERLQNLYNVRGFPTVIFVDGKGDLKNRMEGYGGRAAFDKQLASLTVRSDAPRTSH